MSAARVTGPGESPSEYVAPAVRVVGSVHELTETHIRKNSNGQWCIWKKTIGPPDYFTFIPISNCSP